MKLNVNSVFRVTIKVVTWILQAFNLKVPGTIADYTALCLRFESLIKNRGPIQAVSYIKDVRTCLLNYLAGSPVKLKGVRTTKDGIPTILGALIPHIRVGGSPAMLRILTTILCATRALRLGRVPVLNSIIDGPKRDPIDIGIYVDEFWRDMGYHRQARVTPRSLLFRKFHLTTKSGPNGSTNALATCLADLQALSDSQKDCIYKVGGKNLEEKMNRLERGLKEIPEIQYFVDTTPGVYTRRLRCFPDKELKVRVIAIGDYFTQAALKPLHDYLYRVLKKIPQDCTFNQGSFLEKIENRECYSSVDLTAATDRFPISTIERVLLGRLPKDYVTAWRSLMVDTPFEYEGQYYKYAVGNPMGFYSSWASFAVAHHYVVYYCCRRLHKPWKTLPYSLLGDDIVIADPEVAALYKETISRLGVEFSETKTYTSPYLVEFAKRLIYKGQEISPFPISALSELAGKYYLLVNLLMTLENKGWVSECGAPAAVESFLAIVNNLPSSFRKKLGIKAFVCHRLMKIIRGSQNAGELLSEAYRKLGFTHTLSDFVAQNVLSNIAVDAFARSNPASYKEKPDKRPSIGLGPRAETAVMILTGLDEERFDLGFALIQDMPMLNAYGQITEMYTDLSKEARRISTTGGGEWPMLLKTIALPWDDSIFTMRSSHLISKATSRLVSDLKDRGEILSFYPPEELLRTSP